MDKNETFTVSIDKNIIFVQPNNMDRIPLKLVKREDSKKEGFLGWIYLTPKRP
jgi:hypothetical protein